jgi:hypothetical protein
MQSFAKFLCLLIVAVILKKRHIKNLTYITNYTILYFYNSPKAFGVMPITCADSSV